MVGGTCLQSSSAIKHEHLVSSAGIYIYIANENIIVYISLYSQYIFDEQNERL